MAKPFKLQDGGEEERRANVARGAGGKFERLTQSVVGPDQIKAEDSPEGAREATRAARVPDHPITTKPNTEGTDPVYEETNPWPETVPVHMPMRLKSD